ncbi:MAG: hypothetical protein J0L77_01225 [Alphaproteobacteria bacterium]|nr:hypothetical protein [Alphaproteobacteria bacterium]
MFSSLGPLFKTIFRQAEAADTRLGIRREEKRDGRKRPDFDPSDDDNSLWEDSTDVSIPALRLFLQNFVTGQDGSAQTSPSASISTPQAEIKTSMIPESPPPAIVPGVTAKAISAYQTMGQRSPSYVPPAPILPAAQVTSDVDMLSASDIRIIYQLLEDLEKLSAQGYETLSIGRANSFLESLANAVALLKNGA